MPARVIAGSAKGRRLKLVPGSATRPIMDRVKEALFSIIGRNIYNANVLDLFAGTGSVGIEALSRGARQVLFLDLDRIAIRTIHENLAITGFTEKSIVRRTDALNLLKSPPPADPYDFIYIAPPQYKGIWLIVLNLLDNNIGWLAEDSGSVIVQIDPKEYQETTFRNIILADRRDYGRTTLLFYQRHDTVT